MKDSLLEEALKTWLFLRQRQKKRLYHGRLIFANQDFKVAFVSFQKGAQEGLIEDPNGSEFLKIVEAGDGNRHDHFLASGDVTSIHNILFALNSPTVGAININTTTTPFSIDTPFEGDFYVWQTN